MGTTMSNLEDVNASSPGMTSSVIVFHSKTQLKAHFEALKETEKLLVIDFTATWCGPCRFMEPTFKEYSSTYMDVEFLKIDVDEFLDVAREFGVEAMPAFILVKKGRVVDRVVGTKKEELQKKIEKHRL